MYDIHRGLIERMYEGKCTIIEHEKVQQGSRTENIEKIIAKEIPCKLARNSNNPSMQTDSVSKIDYNTTLFINPEIKIHSGSKLIISQYGVTRVFKQAGEPFMYPTHQEVSLKRTDRS